MLQFKESSFETQEVLPYVCESPDAHEAEETQADKADNQSNELLISHAKGSKRSNAMFIYIKSKGNITKPQIAQIFGVTERTVRRWARDDGWDNALSLVPKHCVESTEKSSSATDCAYDNNFDMHSLLPKETADIISHFTSASPVDILWQNIMLQYAAIIRAQKLMNIESEKILRLEKRTAEGMDSCITEWENHTPWERYRIFMDSQSKAMNSLALMLKRLEDLKKQGLVSEQLSSKILLMKAQHQKLVNESAKYDPVINIISEIDRPD